MGIQRIDNEFLQSWIEGDILYSVYRDGCNIDLDTAKMLYRQRLDLTNGHTYPLFADIRRILYVSREARNFLATEQACMEISAGALLIGSSVSRFMGNFFIKINKPPIPTKLFTDKDAAIEWLSVFQVDQSSVYSNQQSVQ